MRKIIPCRDIKTNKSLLFESDENERKIYYYKFNSVNLTGIDIFYPNCLIYSLEDRKTYNPIDERIMSLEGIEKKNPPHSNNKCNDKIETYPVFYFIYNTDNYYHFIYDTLPYLITFNHIKKNIPNLKLLMNYPNHQLEIFYPFVKEFLNLFGISDSDIVLANDNTTYDTLYFSDSYTHGIDSNLPPRKEIYKLYKDIVKKIKTQYPAKEFNKKIYISRRTWLHNNFSNIGTNYTQKRRLANEDELVHFLEEKGYQEVFTENLSTIEKIQMFSNATHIVGAIGGGVCNVMFSPKTTKLVCLVSPTFLEVNKRFVHSLNIVDTLYFDHSTHMESEKWKKFMRVRSNDLVGEIVDIDGDILTVSYTNTFVAGWNSQMSYNKKQINMNDCIPLDKGLNSSWIVDLDKLKCVVE